MARILATVACLLAASALLGIALAHAVVVEPSNRSATSNGASPKTTPAFETYRVHGEFLVAAQTPVPGQNPAMTAVGHQSSLDVDVPAGATAILVELTVSASPTPGLALYVSDPSSTWSEVHPAQASPSGVLQYRLDVPAAGPYSAFAFAESAAANVQYTVAFTVFYRDVPAGFTAFH